jgi:hypothetical protein
MANRFIRGLKIAGATAAIAVAAAAPAQAATHPAGTPVHLAAPPPGSYTHTYGPYSTWQACDDNSAYYIRAGDVWSVSDCWYTWQGFYFTVRFVQTTSY